MKAAIRNGTIVTHDQTYEANVFIANEAKEISPEWSVAGTDVLLHAVLETAEITG